MVGLTLRMSAVAAFLSAERVSLFRSGVTASRILGLPLSREGLVGGNASTKNPARASHSCARGCKEGTSRQTILRAHFYMQL